MRLVFQRNPRAIRSLAVAAVFVAVVLCLFSDPCLASFESSLVAVKTKLTGIVLPLLSVIGLGFAALSFITGNPNAKTHITYAVVGAVIGFGAQAIVDFIASTVH